MTLIHQEEVGRCSFIDVLEEAALRKSPIAVHTRQGSSFIDHVDDVVTEKGHDYVEFHAQGRLRVSEIEACSRAEPPPVALV